MLAPLPEGPALLRFQRLRALLGRTPGADHMVPLSTETLALQLLEEAVRGGLRKQRGNSNNGGRTQGRTRHEVVQSVKFTLARAPDQPHSLAALSRSVAVSPFHLARVFREEVGLPVHQYLIRLRLAAAVRRLLVDEGTLSRVAVDLGFYSHSHFTTTFRKVLGTTPTAVGRVLRSAPAPATVGANVRNRTMGPGDQRHTLLVLQHLSVD